MSEPAAGGGGGSSRLRAYKNRGLDAEELRRRREEVGVQLRRQRREEQLFKRRNVAADADADCDEAKAAGGVGDSEGGAGTAASAAAAAAPLMDFADAAARLASPDTAVRLLVARQLRRLLSVEPEPPIDALVQCGCLPGLISLLSPGRLAEEQFEAAWCLTNVCSGGREHTEAAVACGAVQPLCQLASHCQQQQQQQQVLQQVLQQALWALANIAGDSVACRDAVLSAGLLPTVVDCLADDTAPVSLVRIASWCCSNLCRGRQPQPPPLHLLLPCLPQLARLLFHEDAEVLADACWALSHVADGANDRIQAVIDCGVCRRLVQLLRHRCAGVVRPALRAIGNLVTGDDIQTQVLLHCELLPNLSQLLRSSSDEWTRKEACWVLSNIGAGNRTQIQAVLDSNIVPVVVDIMQHAEFRTRKEAAWFVVNAASGGSAQQAQYLADCGCVPALCDLLTVADAKVVELALNGLQGLLRCGQRLSSQRLSSQRLAGGGPNRLAVLVEECGGLDRLEYLQSHENVDIYRLAHGIIDAFFGDDYAAAADTDACQPLQLTAHAAHDAHDRADGADGADSADGAGGADGTDGGRHQQMRLRPTQQQAAFHF